MGSAALHVTTKASPVWALVSRTLEAKRDMNEILELEVYLDEILFKINGLALNYVADIKLFLVKDISLNNGGDIVRSAVDSSVKVGQIYESNNKEVLDAIKRALTYEGTESSHPNMEFVGTEHHKYLMGLLLEKMGVCLRKASNVQSFTFQRGHPFYPIYWDFSYILKFRDSIYVLVGSSSD
ncbi:hypothetical protein [Saccharophagus degradans]|uniref:Two component transcriptional regulator, LuxR family n=1 Tax=Saccharophagus degradans (strain 2-40 / ATCC 43961 / DSM 17024) TaxID=203122 RepID=Q21GH8_SACD2|nr:hypothetical protein [Saccharophagus degradans]ABD82201.1 two component transcriptional regulator, LuxR family [Saccharophagus degradans 2-40]